jgi:SAM-dependent methyltransferase
VDAAAPEVRAGAETYGWAALALYDISVTWLNNRYVWHCPAAVINRQYNAYVTVRHLEVGVGTGYHLARARWSGRAAITLADLNENSLRWTARRIRQHEVRTAVVNALEPFPDLPGAPFASAGVGYLLHCIPGRLDEKARAVLGNVAAVLEPGGVVFGSTILAPGPETPPRARRMMRLLNRRGILHNTEDTAADLDRALGAVLAEHTLEQVGEVALFTGRTAAPDGR